MVNYDLATQGAADKGHFANGGATDWMGGAVQEGLGRMHFADQGAVPYSEQPSGGTAKPLTLADIMRVVKYDKVGGRTNIPEAPKAFDQGSLLDVAKQLQNATTEQRANMADNISALRSKLGLGTVAPSDVIGEGQGTYSLGLHYSSGGGIDRQGYAGDTGQSGGVAPEQSDSWLPSKGQSAIEKATGLNLSDNARMGLLAAGLGMLSSRSPFFGVGVGEGATAGLGTYYNALANERAYEKQKRELELTEEARQTERARVALEAAKNPADIARIEAETNAARAGLYEMRVVPGIGLVRVNKLTGKIETNTIPLSPSSTGTGAAGAGAGSSGASSTGASSTAVPTVSTAAPAQPSTEPAPQPKIETPPKTSADLMSWKPTLAAPSEYTPPNQINMFDPEIAKTAKAVAEPVLQQYQNSSDAADQQIFRLHEMNAQEANLPDTGFLGQGAFAEERLKIAQQANAFVQALGGQPVFDQNSLASAEQIQKDSFRLGTELARTLGREPGFIVQQSVQANPGINNTKMGWARITAGLEQAARYQQDKNTFLSDYYQRYGNLNGAEDLFRKYNPPERYSEKAILSTVPVGVYEDLKKYGPNQMRSKIDSVFGQGVTDLMMRK